MTNTEPRMRRVLEMLSRPKTLRTSTGTERPTGDPSRYIADNIGNRKPRCALQRLSLSGGTGRMSIKPIKSLPGDHCDRGFTSALRDIARMHHGAGRDGGVRHGSGCKYESAPTIPRKSPPGQQR